MLRRLSTVCNARRHCSVTIHVTNSYFTQMHAHLDKPNCRVNMHTALSTYSADHGQNLVCTLRRPCKVPQKCVSSICNHMATLTAHVNFV